MGTAIERISAATIESDPDPLPTLRLFADMRLARLKLIGLVTPDAAARARLIRDPAIYKALVDLLYAASQLVSGADETALFWHHERETYGAAEKRFERLRAQFAGKPTKHGKPT